MLINVQSQLPFYAVNKQMFGNLQADFGVTAVSGQPPQPLIYQRYIYIQQKIVTLQAC